ncbi:hypothetical protein [Leifsonia sp. C5G2]|uniref:hypothetical protein n=1 Tax=Leifsonia sp. C5G2 TaxID=2735269 RepID=UPI001584CB9D|nr:hypothetical protein [Leifsonia sp. C5G2]NUU07687.1 hypothetical protein [Leifsonia sp. C5G2]
MKKYMGGIALAASAALTMGLLGASRALADTATDDPLGAVTSATPSTANNAATVTTKETGENAISATVAGADVTVPIDPSSGISLGTSAGDLTVSLPFAAKADDAAAEKKGVVSYDNNNGSTTVPVVTKDGSLQVNAVISAATAPKRYTYDLTLPAGGQIVQAGEGYFIVNAESNAVAYVSAPWAKDANGAQVPTHYELSGSTLTQVVDFTSTTAFPVVADPQFAWHGILPSVKLTRAETKTATTLTGMATVCGWVGRYTSAAGAALCGLNAASIIVNTQRIYFNEKRCAQLLVGPGVIGTIGYSGGYCK